MTRQKKPQPGLPAEAFASGQREAEKAQVSPAADGSSPVLVRRADLDGPSVNNRRRDDREPYRVAEGKLEFCIREFMSKPAVTRELYDIRTAPQPPLVPPIMDVQQVAELVRFGDFL
jgi:hypothetical protein